MARNNGTANVDSLLNFGILALQHGGHRSLPMTDVLPLLLNSTTAATTLISPFATKHGIPTKEAATAVDHFLAGLRTYLAGVDHRNCFAMATVQSVVPPCIAAGFLTMRFGVRHFITGRIRRDDWAMLVTWLLALGMMIAMYTNHAGSHVWDMSFDQYSGFLFTFFIIEIIYGLCLYAIKIAFMIFFWDLSPIRSMRIALVVVFVITTMAITAGAFCIILQCKPVAYWKDPVGAKCLPLDKIWLWTGVVTIAGDLALLFVPIPFVWRLKINTREKLIVIAMFGIGAFVCIASIYRVVTTVRFVNDPDITYKVGISQMWAILEINLGIIVSCVPAMRALVVRFMPRLIGHVPSAHRKAGAQNPAIQLEESANTDDAERAREGKKREWLQRREDRDKKYRIGVGLTSDYSKEGESILEAVRMVESGEELASPRGAR